MLELKKFILMWDNPQSILIKDASISNSSEKNYRGYLKVKGSSKGSEYKMVNAVRGLFISCDIPMAQFIINMDAAMPASQKFIIRVLDSNHLFVQPYVAEMIKSRISEFRDQNSYEKPA